MRAALVRICSLCARYGAMASARQEAGLQLTGQDRTGGAEFQGFDNHCWAPEVIKLSLHFTLTFEASVLFNGAGCIGTSPASRVHVVQEHRQPSNEEVSNPWFGRLTSDRVHSFVSPKNCAETALLLRLQTSSPDWSDCCENGSDVITAKLQAQHL
jgi:hypothetical protein